MNIKVVILSHNMPENVDRLHGELSRVFDVEVMDCGSEPSQIPKSLTVPMKNVYWEGAWIEAMNRWNECDVLWVLGGDITLTKRATQYKMAIEEAMPFGCWSPAIEGRAHPFMLSKFYKGERHAVRNVEGMAMAVSKELMKAIGRKFEVLTKFGFGQDYWMSAMARRNGMTNYIDGFVPVGHPSEIGYNEGDAHQLMESMFSAHFGKDFRRTLFEYREDFEGNLLKEKRMSDKKRLTIATVDNGWGVQEFDRITSEFPDCRKVIMRKGVTEFASLSEVVDYDSEMKEVLDADIALFTRIGAANIDEFKRVLAAGIPVVVSEAHYKGMFTHEEDGLIYGHESWGASWIRSLIDDEGLRLRIGGKAAHNSKKKVDKPNQEPENSEPEKKSEPEKSEEIPDVDVTIITPTFRRDPRIVSRCIDCVRLQTVSNVEQLVCSDGAPEPQIATLVGSIGDERVSYHHTDIKKPGDYGNVVRSEMLKRARGKYVLFMDDDNLIVPSYLERMIQAIEESGKDFAVCEVVHFGPLREEAVGRPPKVLNGDPVKLHHIDTLQVLVKREAMQEVGWDTEHGYLADGHTLQALGEKFEHVMVSEVLGFHM